MALHFKIFYHSQEHGDHLRQVIDASGSGRLVEVDDLSHLPMASRAGTDVFLLEYQEDNPQLDQWIEATASDPDNPAVFLVFPEISTVHLWKALHLGVKECFTLPVQPQEFQEAVNRLLVRTTLKTPESCSPEAKMITFMGCKGGLGATFLASNLAYLLSREHQGQVCWWTWICNMRNWPTSSISKPGIPSARPSPISTSWIILFCKTCFIPIINSFPYCRLRPAWKRPRPSLRTIWGRSCLI